MTGHSEVAGTSSDQYRSNALVSTRSVVRGLLPNRKVARNGLRRISIVTETACPVVTRAAAKKHKNRIIRLICPFLPPRIFVKCPSIRKMNGSGGGDRTKGDIENS